MEWCKLYANDHFFYYFGCYYWKIYSSYYWIGCFVSLFFWEFFCSTWKNILQKNRASSHKTQKSSVTGIIIGSVIGGIAFIALVAILLLFLKRRKRRNGGNNSNEGNREGVARSSTENRSNSIELRNSTYKTILNIEINERLGGGAFSGNVTLYFCINANQMCIKDFGM